MAVARDDAEIRSFAPRWPDLSALSPDRVDITYDGPSDTLFVDFFGGARQAASFALDLDEIDYFYLRVDVETEEVVGLQIEHFLGYAVAQHPWLTRAFDIATLEDATALDIPSAGRDEVANGSRRDARMELVGNLVRLGR
jgi:hypothetical protein